MSDDDVVVGEGRWQTKEAKALVNGLPLGPKAVKVFLDVVHEQGTYLWRPTMDLAYLDDCLNSFISWPARKVVFENTPGSTRQHSPSPNTAPSSSVRHGRETGSKDTSVGSPAGKTVTKGAKSGATTSSPTEDSPPTDQVIFFLLVLLSSDYISLSLNLCSCIL